MYLCVRIYFDIVTAEQWKLKGSKEIAYIHSVVFSAPVKMEDALYAVIWKHLSIYCSIGKARYGAVYGKSLFVLEYETMWVYFPVWLHLLLSGEMHKKLVG